MMNYKDESEIMFIGHLVFVVFSLLSKQELTIEEESLPIHLFSYSHPYIAFINHDLRRFLT